MYTLYYLLKQLPFLDFKISKKKFISNPEIHQVKMCFLKEENSALRKQIEAIQLAIELQKSESSLKAKQNSRAIHSLQMNVTLMTAMNAQQEKYLHELMQSTQPATFLEEAVQRLLLKHLINLSYYFNFNTVQKLLVILFIVKLYARINIFNTVQLHGFHNSTVRLQTRDYSKFPCLFT